MSDYFYSLEWAARRWAQWRECMRLKMTLRNLSNEENQ